MSFWKAFFSPTVGIQSCKMRFPKVGVHSWACLGLGEDVLHSYGANQGYVLDEQTCLFVDSGFHNRTATQILGRVREQKPARLILVDTHYHSDHVFGNSVLGDEGAAIISHEKCRRKMINQSTRLLSNYRARDSRLTKLLEKVRITYPTITYRDNLKVHLDQIEAEIVHPDMRAHTDGDSMVYVPEDRVLFSGDVLWVGYHPNLEDADIKGQIKALKQILRLRPRKIVPGHGPVGRIADVRRFIRYLEELDQNLHEALADKLPLAQTTTRSIPKWSDGWKMRWLAESYVRSRWDSRQAY